jgi:REP element-mobilizing transposase RayT
VGGTDDHVHILCRLARTVSVSKAVEKIKTGSSKWIKTKHNRYQSFGWQNGYGAFSIGASQIDVLRKYISNQREHHRKRTFQEEFRELCEKYNIEYDERYVWN